ncbi:hypothetical protein [Fimbriimonas ginsengisoli]|uniref:Uncharacterized protein n=1 Tax=Fimbriimonas ginsengisoli Gsoil 348 TaxID=661478 RepID=A0A068NIP3_FIMGI|nr:hypothetical protein [Fimbriimonas ginsengisoli]AIE83401.1 hypothetical protein OP10G_0033 [Fimbriimonas ginsengisoli Gsoil 348]
MEQLRELMIAGNLADVQSLIEVQKPKDAAEAYHRLGKDLYWKDKNLAASRAALTTGIAYALEQARNTGSPELIGAAKGMYYDLASFSWPGWDEPGIEIDEEALSFGEYAADENLRLAIELQRSDQPMASAHFIVGAFHLVRRRWPEARESFQRYRYHADRYGDAANAMLAEGYSLLTDRLETGASCLEQFCEKLRAEGGDDGVFYADQLFTAAKALA